MPITVFSKERWRNKLPSKRISKNKLSSFSINVFDIINRNDWNSPSLCSKIVLIEEFYPFSSDLMKDGRYKNEPRTH